MPSILHAASRVAPSPSRIFAPLLAAATLIAVTAETGAAMQTVPPDLQVRINDAIDRGIDHLQRAQHRDGSWTGPAFGSYRAGPTAFSSFALVEAGVSPDSASIVMALDYLKNNPPRMTYSAGALLLLLAEIGGEDHLEWAETTLEQLIQWESQSLRGAWSYPSGPVDLSNTQFAALGFLAASRLGLKVPLDLTRRMVTTTIDRHQEDPHVVDGPPTVSSSGSGTRKRRVAGFTYFPDGRNRPASGSMTAAGVGIQRIARLLHGKRLGGKLLRAMETSEALGIGWIGAHWSVSTNHGHPDGGHVLYYLYAIERLGAYLDTETIEGHRWYEEGAREILSRQKDDGGWDRYHQTSDALLFLSRATRPSLTGPVRKAREDLWTLSEGRIGIRATGQMKLVAWITSFDVEGDVRIESVDWLVDGEVVSTLPGDAVSNWRGERFPLNWTSDRTRTITLTAVVKAVHPDGQPEEIRSGPLRIDCAWSPSEWIATAVAGRGPNLLRGAELSAEASSEAAGQHASRAVDGYEGTAWIASPGDPIPRLSLGLERSVRAEAVTLSHPASSVVGLSTVSGATRVRLTINGKASEHELPPESAAPMAIPLAKRTRVRSIQVEILAPPGNTSTRRGFAEIGLR